MDIRERRGAAHLPALLTIVIVVAILFFARDVFIPLALALLFTFVLAPPVRFLERWRMPRIAAVLLLVIATGAGVLALAWAFKNQLADLAAQLPAYRENMVAKFEALRRAPDGVLAQAQSAISEIGAAPAEPSPGAASTPGTPLPVRVVESAPAPIKSAVAVLTALVDPLATAGIVILFTIFMLCRREDLRNRLIRLIGERDMHVTTQAIDDAAHRVSRYLFMQSVLNALVGVVIGVGLFFIGVPNAWFWGLFAAVLRYVPYVGIWIAAAVPIVISLATTEGFSQPLMVAGLFVAVEILSFNAIEPLLFGSGTGVAPFALLVAAVFWTWLWGGIGLLLSTPITVCMVVIGRHVPGLRFLSILLREEPALPPATRLYQRLLAEDQEEAERIITHAAKTKERVALLDSLVLPALRMSEAHRHSGDVDEERARSIADALEMALEDLGAATEPPRQDEAGAPPRAGADPSQPRKGAAPVLCIPARDRADEVAARMLAQLLAVEGVACDVLSAETLTGEQIGEVVERAPPVVCISAVPPGVAAHVRVLLKRLRARLPNLPIVVAVWDADADPERVRVSCGREACDRAVTSFADAIAMIRPLAVGDAQRPVEVDSTRPAPPLAAAS